MVSCDGVAEEAQAMGILDFLNCRNLLRNALEEWWMMDVGRVVIPGKELVYALYIPLDLLLSFGRAAFFWQNYYLDKLRKEDKKKLKDRLAKAETKRR